MNMEARVRCQVSSSVVLCLFLFIKDLKNICICVEGMYTCVLVAKEARRVGTLELELPVIVSCPT